LSQETPAQRLFEANGGFSRGEQRFHLPRDARQALHGYKAPLIAWAISVGNGSSMALRKSHALVLEGFDQALDLGPPVLPGGGDLDMFWRMLSAGYDLVYEPEALVWHEHRRELAAMYDQVVGHQRALLAFLSKAFKQARTTQRLTILIFIIWRLLKPGQRLLLRLLGRDPLPVRVLWRMWRHCWVGVFTYPSAQRMARDRLARRPVA
jgi:hypothetical protein